MTAIPPAITASNDPLLRLPFDQYGRYRMVSEAIEAARLALGSERLRILDVGGYYEEADGTPRLPSKQFLGDNDLTVLDLPACDLPGYIQGDGTAMTFADGSFDLVMSCDTLEHIPPPLREQFLRELVRVSRYGVVLICPVYSYATALGEQILDQYIQDELHARHPALREHVEYGLPSVELIDDALAGAGCNFNHYPSGYLYTWLPMMLAKHYLQRFGDPTPVLHYALDELYNLSFAADDRCEPSYRSLVVAARENTNDWLAAVNRALEPTVRRGDAARYEAWQGLGAQMLWLLRLGQDDRQEETRAQIMHQHITGLQQIIADQHWQIAKLEEQHRIAIADLEQRARWQEGVAREAHARLAAIEQNPLIRIVRRFRRS